MKYSLVNTSVMLAAGLSLAMLPIAVSSASAQSRDYDEGAAPPGQDYPPPQGDYGQYPPQGYQSAPPRGDYGQYPSQGYDQSAPPPGYGAPQQDYENGGAASPPPPPPGYDGTRPPPPPPGYQADAQYPQQQAQDQRYAGYAEQWARAYCVKAHGNTGAGAVIGGVLGAVLGSSIAGRGGHAAGAIAGGAVGAVGGAAIADSSGGNATSPGCPPGFVVRRDAPAFAYGGGPYVYDAPGWYRPWVYYGGAWVYRPYPYHAWYYRHYYRPHGYRRGGYRHRR